MLKRFAVFLFFLIILFILPIPWTAAARNLVATGLKPVSGYLIRQHATAYNFIQNIRQIGSLRQDKSQLQTQVIELQQQLSVLESTKRENEVLRKEAGISGVTKPIKKAFAHIILVPGDSRDRTFVIDIGQNQGVKVGQPAIHQGALIGKVVSVRQDTAVVRSITSEHSRVQVWIAESREKGLLYGDGNGAYIGDITQGITVSQNAIIETSGLRDSLPQGILVGEVKSILSKRSDLSQSFQVKLTEDPLGLESVFILLTDVQL